MRTPLARLVDQLMTSAELAQEDLDRSVCTEDLIQRASYLLGVRVSLRHALAAFADEQNAKPAQVKIERSVA